jgi:hypothetical protein
MEINVCNVVAQGSNAFSADIPDILLQWNVEDPVSQFELNKYHFRVFKETEILLIILPLLQQFGEDLRRFDGSVQVDTEAPSAPATLLCYQYNR